MTGAEHVMKAEKLLADAAHGLSSATANTINEVAEMATIAVATAQVHATLALAAATRDASADDAMCAHGSTGLCMACLIPLIDAYGQRLTEAVAR